MVPDNPLSTYAYQLSSAAASAPDEVPPRTWTRAIATGTATRDQRDAVECWALARAVPTTWYAERVTLLGGLEAWTTIRGCIARLAATQPEMLWEDLEQAFDRYQSVRALARARGLRVIGAADEDALEALIRDHGA